MTAGSTLDPDAMPDPGLRRPPGHDTGSLGPRDRSDTGSDSVGPQGYDAPILAEDADSVGPGVGTDSTADAFPPFSTTSREGACTTAEGSVCAVSLSAVFAFAASVRTDCSLVFAPALPASGRRLSGR